MRVVVIIQARTSSSRLPGKVERRVGKHRLIDWVLKYCTESSADDVVLAVPSTQVSDFSAMVDEHRSIHIFGGSEDNVASRFVEAGIQHKADYVIRVTCDDPFKPVELIDAIIHLCRLDRFDYISNNMETIFPEGFDIEGIRLGALIRSIQEDSSEFNLEHVTPFMRTGKNFSRLWLSSNRSDALMRCTIDYAKDIEIASELASTKGRVSYQEIRDFFNENEARLVEYLKNNRSEYYRENQ